MNIIFKKLGNLLVEISGSPIWVRKANVNLKNQMLWVDNDYINNVLSEPINFVFCESNLPGFTIETKNNSPKKIILNISKWHEVNASVMFQILSILSGNLLIHGNCLIDKSKDLAFVFAAKGGVGKTSMLLEAIQKGDGKYMFGGDDLVWINLKEKKVKPFFRPLCIYNYHYIKFSKFFINKQFRFRFLRPSLFFRIINVFMINLEAILGLNSFISFYRSFNVIPFDRYALVDPIILFGQNNLYSLNLSSVGYLKSGISFKRESISNDLLSSLICESTHDEFSGYVLQLNQICSQLYNKNFENYLKDNVENLLKDQFDNYIVHTNGNWELDQILKITHL